MTLSTTTSRITYAGDGSTVSFAVPFSFFGADEIDVIERNAETGNETPKVLTTDYTVSGGGGATGTVTAVAAPDATKSWTIARRTKRTQMIDYTPNDPFPAETHERALDRLTALVQELDEKLGRAAALSPTSPLINVTLPTPEAGRLLGWRGDANGLENKNVPTGMTVYTPIDVTRAGVASSESVTPRGLASLWRKGSDIASEAVLSRPADVNLGGYHVVTGSTTVTGLWSGEVAGSEIELRFAAALTLTHNASSFILPGGGNVVAVAGDVARFRAEGGANWRCVSAPPGWFGQASGIGLPANNKSTTYTMLATDKGTEINFTAAGVALNLMAAAAAGNGAVIGVRNAASSGDVTIDPSGAETLDGLATRLLRPGDNVLLRCDGGAWRTISGSYSFESAEQTVAIGTVIVVAHGLGVRPNYIRAAFRCKATDANWAVGDEIDYTSVNWTYGASLAADATNAVATMNQTYAPSIGNKSTGSGGAMTAGNWKLVFFCKDMRG
ncbi:hypothetical protein [Dongia rigui]|uniref:Uncharacterized protein n=1 Tax=Dongia rigui TaxID=940149 RepID=A0ABU5DYW1_9PROT|nr:hypothetical protein [Dongia rigui]MDY0872519.1 hypothetical protein [Dongia rigui]